MVLNRLPTIMIEPLVRAALLEDLGQAGDLTSDAIVPATVAIRAAFKARQAGVIAGLDLASLAFRLLDERSRYPANTLTESRSGRGKRSALCRALRARF